MFPAEKNCMVFLFIGSKLLRHYAIFIFCKSVLFLKEVNIYLFEHMSVVHGCGISKPNRFIFKPLHELSHTYNQDAEEPMQVTLRIYCCHNPWVNGPEYKEEIQPTLLSYTLQGLMIKENLNINNAWSIT